MPLSSGWTVSSNGHWCRHRSAPTGDQFEHDTCEHTSIIIIIIIMIIMSISIINIAIIIIITQLTDDATRQHMCMNAK